MVRELKLSDKINWADDSDVESPKNTQVNVDSNIREVDYLDGMINYHFFECNNESDDLTKSYRGIVKADDKVICKTFGYTPEISESNDSEIEKFVVPFIGTSTCFLSYEATLIRVFFYKEKWYITTCRKLDAFTSRWGSSKSFGELFVEGLIKKEGEDSTIAAPSESETKFPNRKTFQEWCESNLLKDRVYVFIIRTNDENRIVCKGYETCEVFFVGTFDDNGSVSLSLKDSDVLGKCMEQVEVNNLSEVNEKMKEIDTDKVQGLIFINEKGQCVKLMKDKYLEYLKVRGNQPHVLLRYIELQQLGDNETTSKLVNELYPEKRELFVELTEILDDIAVNIYRKYRNRFVRKMVSIAPPDQYYVIRELHEYYLQDKEKNIITPEKVSSYVYTLKPERLFGLYRNYVKRKIQTGHGNKIQEEFATKVKNTIFN